MAASTGTGTGTGPDAELIRLCDRLVAIRAEENAICEADEWAPDRGPYKVRYDALWQEHERVTAQLYETADPVTPAGLRAAARAAICVAPKDAGGDITCDGLAEWLAFRREKSGRHVATSGGEKLIRWTVTRLHGCDLWEVERVHWDDAGWIVFETRITRSLTAGQRWCEDEARNDGLLRPLTAASRPAHRSAEG